VKDNGVGIEVKPNQDVFTMFMRGSEKSETGGVGLYLCKICTDRLQGSIKLEKTSKAGTIFSIRISQDATDQVMELNEALLAQLPALEMIAVFSAGYEGLDVAGARARGLRTTQNFYRCASLATTSALGAGGVSRH
jgi:hypothetical protein